MSIFKDTYDIIKSLLGAAKAIGNQVLVDKAMELQVNLFEFKEENENLKEKIHELQEQIKQNETSIEFEKTMVFYEQPCYSIKDDSTRRIFCVNCWNLNKIKVQLINSNSGYFVCSNCKAKFARPKGTF